MEKEKYKVGITLGDYNGIGPEVIIKTLADDRIYRFCSVVVYGQKGVIAFYAKHLKIQNFNIQEVKDVQSLNPKIPKHYLIAGVEQTQVLPGQMTSDSGARALLCLNAGVKDLIDQKIDVFVTGPVNKKSSGRSGGFNGQTDIFVGAEMKSMSCVMRIALVVHLFVKNAENRSCCRMKAKSERFLEAIGR